MIEPTVEALIKASGIPFRIGGDRAFYATAEDYVQVPPPQAYFEPINWHRTALHELGHYRQEYPCSESLARGQTVGAPRPRSRETARRQIGGLARNRWLILCVFLPFVAAYYLSFIFRTINATIAGSLTAEFGLGAGDLGLLTSVYFLTFAAAQIPIGIWLDRYGPRRIQSAVLVAATTGAALFAASDNFLLLLTGRALIGLGVAASLTAGLKALVLWFPRDRVPLLNGLMIMLGALGAVTATLPAEFLLASMGWRGLFELLAMASAGCALVYYLVVPETPAPMPVAGGPAAEQFEDGLRRSTFLASAHFRRPVSGRLGRYRDCGRRHGSAMSRASIGRR